MNIMKFLVLSWLILAANTSLAWDSLEIGEFYVGLDASYADVDIADESSNPYVVMAKAGFTLKPQVALEFQYGTGVSDDELLSHTVDIDSSAGVFLRLISRKVNDVTADIMLGYARTEVSLSGTSESSETFSDAAFGVGLNQYYPKLPNLVLRMDYKSYYSEDDLRIRTFSLGANYLF